MEMKDSEMITSSLLKVQNHKLMSYKDIVLVTIVMNLFVLTLTLIQEIVCFEDLEDYEIIMISIIVKSIEFLLDFIKEMLLGWRIYCCRNVCHYHSIFFEPNCYTLLHLLVFFFIFS